MGAPVRIARATVYLAHVPLRFRVAHALAARTANVTGYVVLCGPDGAAGIGEFLCRDYVTGETPEGCVAVLRRLGPRLAHAVIDDPAAFLRALWPEERARPGHPGARAALEMALLDLWGKTTGRPIADLLARPEDRHRALTCSAVYPLTRGLVLAALHLFYRTVMRMDQVKVKGTGEVEADLASLARIRRAYPYPVDLRLDLNGSLRPASAAAYFGRLLESPHGVRWVEQPFPKEDLESAARFQEAHRGRLILCGDESICSREDLEAVIRTGAFGAVNIRLAKHGGLLDALAIYDRAAAAGLEVQLGCLVGESSVLGYAGLQLAALMGAIRYYEGCFGRYLVRWDAVSPSLVFARGGRVSTDRLPPAGLVPAFDEARLRRAASARVSLVGT